MTTSTTAKEVARAHRLRQLMHGPADPIRQIAGIREIIDERITELKPKDDGNGSGSGSKSES